MPNLLPSDLLSFCEKGTPPTLARINPSNHQHDHNDVRSAPCRSRVAAQSSLRNGGDPLPRTRNRRKYRDIHPDRPDPAPETAGCRSGRAGDALPAGTEYGQQHGLADELVSALSGSPETRRAAGRRPVPAPRRRLDQRRQPDGAGLGRNGVRQLLHAARRQAGDRTRVQFQRGRPAVRRSSRCGAQPRLLGQSLRPGSGRHRQEDPGERSSDDHRGGVCGRLRRARSGALAADPGAGAHEAGDDSRLDLAAHGRSARQVGAGVRPAQNGIHGRVSAGPRAGPVSADPQLRSDAAAGEGLVGVRPGTVPEERTTPCNDRRARLLGTP